jgi:hypothetical protein
MERMPLEDYLQCVCGIWVFLMGVTLLTALIVYFKEKK